MLLIIFSCKKKEMALLSKIDFFVEVKQCENDTCLVYFYDNSLNVSTRNWDFGNGEISKLPVDSTFYSQNDSYTVTLRIKNADDIEVTGSKNINF